VAHPRAEEVTTAARIVQFPEVRRLLTPHTATPQAHLLSNGRYSVMLTDAGSGYSRWRALDVTRWREDSTRDDSGSYFFLRDIESGAVWSASYQPSGIEPDSYQVTFAEDRAEFVRRDAMIATTLEIVVSPEDDAEVRRVSIANGGNRVRDIEADRARFLGRGRGIRSPVAVLDGRRLSNTVGTVLDPVFVLRQRVRVPAGATVHVAFWTASAASRENALDLVDKHHEPNAFVRASTLAWTQAQVQLRHLGIDAAEASLFHRLAGHV